MNIKLILFYLINYALIFLTYIPSNINFISSYFPALDIIFLFYFYGYKNHNLSFLFIFLISLISDTVAQNILGTTAFIYFLILLTFPYQRKMFFFKSFTEIWFAFLIFMTQIFLLEALLNFFTNSRSPDFQSLALEFLISLSLYPLFHLFFHKLSEYFLSINDAHAN